jgi:hypothetical protein
MEGAKMMANKIYHSKNETRKSIERRLTEDGDCCVKCPGCGRHYKDSVYSNAIGICPFCSFENGIIVSRR